MEVFRQHNDQLKSLIGKDNSKATYTKYRTTSDHTISFHKTIPNFEGYIAFQLLNDQDLELKELLKS